MVSGTAFRACDDHDLLGISGIEIDCISWH